MTVIPRPCSTSIPACMELYPPWIIVATRDIPAPVVLAGVALFDSKTTRASLLLTGPFTSALELHLPLRCIQEERDGRLKTLDTRPFEAYKSGRITGRQAQTMPTQGSRKESITDGAWLQGIMEGSLITRDTRYVRAIEAKISLSFTISRLSANVILKIVLTSTRVRR